MQRIALALAILVVPLTAARAEAPLPASHLETAHGLVQIGRAHV